MIKKHLSPPQYGSFLQRLVQNYFSFFSCLDIVPFNHLTKDDFSLLHEYVVMTALNLDEDFSREAFQLSKTLAGTVSTNNDARVEDAG